MMVSKSENVLGPLQLGLCLNVSEVLHAPAQDRKELICVFNMEGKYTCVTSGMTSHPHCVIPSYSIVMANFSAGAKPSREMNRRGLKSHTFFILLYSYSVKPTDKNTM